MPYYVYILTNRRRSTLYTGSTNNLVRRINEHRTGAVPGFSKRYKLDQLVHFEQFNDYPNAAQREKRIKKWKRDWKIELIEKQNPDWVDLWPSIAHIQ